MRLVARARTVPAAAWGAQVTFVLLLLAASTLFPAHRGPDEPHHVDLVYRLSRGEAYPDPGELYISTAVAGSLRTVRFHDGSANLEAWEAPPRAERQRFEDYGGLDDSAAYNQIAQHPPLYYRLAEAWLRIGRGVGLVGSFDQVVSWLRLLSVALVAPLPLLSYAIARRLGAAGQAPVVAAMVPLAIPQLIHIGSVVNNDSLSLLTFWVLTYLVARVLTGDLGWGTTLGVGVAAALGLLTKAHALVALPWLVMVYAVVWWRRRDERRVVAGRAMAAGAVAAVGFGWWIRNVVVFGKLRPGGRAYPPPPPDFEPDLGWWLELFGRWMSFRFWGDFGWLEVRLPAGLVVAAMGATVGAVVLAFVLRQPVRRGDLFLVLVPTGGLLAMIGLGAYSGYASTTLTAGIQGRYLYGGLAGLAVVVGVGLDAAFRRWRAWAPAAVVAGAMVLVSFSFLQVMRAYWGPPGGSLGAQVHAAGVWSPWFDRLPSALTGLAGLALGALGVLLALGALGRGPVAPGGPDGRARQPDA